MSKSRPVYWMWRAEPLSLPLFSAVEIIPRPPDLDAGSEGFSHRSPVSPHPGLATGPPPHRRAFATLLRQPKCKGLRLTPLRLPWRGATGAGEPERPGQEPGGRGAPHRPAASIGLPRLPGREHAVHHRRGKTSTLPGTGAATKPPATSSSGWGHPGPCFGPKFPGNLG